MRLDAWVIEALEADQYARVGPAVYAKGHLKKYASILGISADEILSAYEAVRTAPEGPPPVAPSMRLRAPTQAVSNLPRGQIAVLAVLLLALACVILWKPWHQRPASPVAAPAQARTAEPRSVQAPDASQPLDAATSGADPGTAESPIESAQTGSAPANAASAAAAMTDARESAAGPGHGPTRLRLSFSAESWVDIHDVEGKRVYSGYGRANSVKSLAGDGPLKVYLGYASGVQLEINERAVAIAASFVHGDVARFQAGADGVLRSFTSDSHPPG
jgi:cytoskeleton protein RodZ